MAYNKQAKKTIQERHGTPEDPNKHWREAGKKGNEAQGAHPFDEPSFASKAARKRWDAYYAAHPEKKRLQKS